MGELINLEEWKEKNERGWLVIRESCKKCKYKCIAVVPLCLYEKGVLRCGSCDELTGYATALWLFDEEHFQELP